MISCSCMKYVKVVIDIMLGLLFLLLLGYSFTGGQFHETAGIVYMAAAVVHNIVNIKWYQAVKKGTYNRKRRLITTINFALVADMAALLLTGVLHSRYLFHTGIRIKGIGQIHTVLSLLGFVLIVSHVLVHVFSHTKKKYRKLPVVLTISAAVLAVFLDLWMLPYLKRDFQKVEICRETVISGERVNIDGRKIITVYFTRVGNTDFEDNTDAVSGASLLSDENGELMGNSQVIGQMIQNAAGGDLIAISTKKKYPSSYSDTVSAASEEMSRQELPELINMPENIDGYDIVFVVYPLWWHTIPKPVEAFLSSYDLTGKTVIPVVTHGGGGSGESVEDIKAVCSGTVVENPLEVYCGDIPYCRERVAEWLKERYSELLY